MKKLICLAILIALVFPGLTGCKKSATKAHPKARKATAAGTTATAEETKAGRPAPETMTLVSKTDVKLSDTPALLVNGSFEKWQPGEPAPRGFNAPVGNKSAIRKEMKDVADGVLAVNQTWQAPDGGDSFTNKFGTNIPGLKAHGKYLFEIKVKNASEKHVTVSAWQETGVASNPYERIKEASIDIPPQMTDFAALSCPVVPNTDRPVRIFTGCNDKNGAFPATVIWEDWKLTETK